MKETIKRFYGSEPLVMVFEMPMDVIIKNLKSKVGRTSFYRIFSHRMVGKIKEKRVVIQHVLPFGRNPFKPIFFGSFKSDGSVTTLSGVFRVSRIVQVVTTFLLGFTALMLAIAIAAPILDPTKSWFTALEILLFLMLGVGIVALGGWLAHHDKAWLKENITNAIQQSE